MVLLRIPPAVHSMTGIEGLKYQASDGLGRLSILYYFKNFCVNISLNNLHSILKISVLMIPVSI